MHCGVFVTSRIAVTLCYIVGICHFIDISSYILYREFMAGIFVLTHIPVYFNTGMAFTDNNRRQLYATDGSICECRMEAAAVVVGEWAYTRSADIIIFHLLTYACYHLAGTKFMFFILTRIIVLTVSAYCFGLFAMK